MLLRQSFALAITLLGVGISGAARAGDAPLGETAVTCTNPASGAQWQIKVDYARNTVDSNAASVTDAKIAWRDAKDGGNYTLDRKSGKLTVIVASSTGGYFVYDQCNLGNPG